MKRRSSFIQRVFFTFTCHVLPLISDGNYARAIRESSFGRKSANFLCQFCYTLYEHISDSKIGDIYEMNVKRYRFTRYKKCKL